MKRVPRSTIMALGLWIVVAIWQLISSLPAYVLWMQSKNANIWMKLCVLGTIAVAWISFTVLLPWAVNRILKNAHSEYDALTEKLKQQTQEAEFYAREIQRLQKLIPKLVMGYDFDEGELEFKFKIGIETLKQTPAAERAAYVTKYVERALNDLNADFGILG